MWGLSNSSGQLGIRENSPQNLPVIVSALAERVATQVECGFDFCLALGQDCVRTTVPVEISPNNSVKDDLEDRLEEENEIDQPSIVQQHGSNSNPNDVQFDLRIQNLGSSIPSSTNYPTPLEFYKKKENDADQNNATFVE